MSFLKYLFFSLPCFLRDLDNVMVDVTYVTGKTRKKLKSLLRKSKIGISKIFKQIVSNQSS